MCTYVNSTVGQHFVSVDV